MERVREIIADILGIQPSEVALSDTLEEIGLGELIEKLEVGYLMEESFNLRPFPDEEIEGWITVKDVSDSVERRIDGLQE